MESMLYQGHGFLGGIKHFWMAVRVWKTNLVLEDLARQKRTKMWPKCGISWGLIDVWQSEWSVVCWIWIAKPSTKFWPSNWACRKFVPSWSQKFSPMNRRKTEGMCACTFLNALKMTKFFQTCHNRWWNVDFGIRSWHQTTKFGVAHELLTAPKESKNEQIRTMLICFFFLAVKALFIRNLCLKDKQLINSTIVRSLNDS